MSAKCESTLVRLCHNTLTHSAHTTHTAQPVYLYPWVDIPAFCLLVTAPSAHHSTTQHSTAQHSTTQHSTAQHSTTQHDTTQHSTAQHNTAQHSTTQHNTAQHSTAHHSTTQHSTTQHSTAQHSIAQHSAHHTPQGHRTFEDARHNVPNKLKYDQLLAKLEAAGIRRTLTVADFLGFVQRVYHHEQGAVATLERLYRALEAAGDAPVLPPPEPAGQPGDAPVLPPPEPAGAPEGASGDDSSSSGSGSDIDPADPLDPFGLFSFIEAAATELDGPGGSSEPNGAGPGTEAHAVPSAPMLLGIASAGCAEGGREAKRARH